MNQTRDDVRADSVGAIRGVTFSEKRGQFDIFARAESVGDDVLVVLWGGIAHIGAVGIAQPRPSLRD